MSRAFGATNTGLPLPVRKLIPIRPECFERAADWAGWLVAAFQSVQGDESARQAFYKGRPPSICEDCSQWFETRMSSRGLCHRVRYTNQPRNCG